VTALTRDFSYDGIAGEEKKPRESLRRVFAPRGNPSAENFLGIVKALQPSGNSKMESSPPIGLAVVSIVRMLIER
jgi:hypothetical protein